MNLAGNGYDVIKWSEYDKSSWQGKLTAKPWTFGRNGFFQDLNQHIGFSTQYLVDLSCLNDFRFNGEPAKIKSPFRFILHAHAGKFKEGAGVWAQVRIVEECVFFKTNIHKSSIQTRDKFFDFTQV